MDKGQFIEEHHEQKTSGRRRFLKRTAIATGAVWTTPVVIGALEPVAAATGSGGCPFTYCFDDGTTEGWTIDNSAGSGSGLWNVNDSRSVSPTFSLHYGTGIGGSYATGGTNSGTVTSPSFTVPATGGDLTFDIWREIEQFDTGTWDEFSVTILPSATVEYAVSADGGTSGVFEPIAIDLGAYAGQAIQVVFAFDTGDNNFNNFEGVYVDNVTVPCNTPPPAGAGLLAGTTLNARSATQESFFPQRQALTNREQRQRDRATRQLLPERPQFTNDVVQPESLPR